MSSVTWRRYNSANAIEILRHGDLILGVQLASIDQHALALAEIDLLSLEAFEPCVLVTVGEEEEQPLDLYVTAVRQELLQLARTEVGESFHQLVDLMKAFAVGQFVHQFEHGPFRSRKRERPIPLAQFIKHQDRQT